MNNRKTVRSLDPDSLLWQREMGISSDVLGSYTGRLQDPYEVPVQDADDL